ncbi:hypothetical protein L6164_037603 [Bauhinia variegata]|uniref:Uncharacterized protein n=1 Tax=Bauhinia variegata TaxID=167791 RepID=A0ACB9KKD7_BAUVA|nr:hypothetical protein L6164_037603 [Bauhinia variegata]
MYIARSIARTVSDAVYVLDIIAGLDYNDPATATWSRYIPLGGFKQYLNPYGLKGKRLGIVRNPFFGFIEDPAVTQAFEKHFLTLRREGAVLVDNLQIANIDIILNQNKSGEAVALIAEFKLSLNAYLKGLEVSPVRSLADIIAFNQKNADLAALANLARLSKEGFEKLMTDNKLDALVTPGSTVAPVLAIGGFPGINVPAGYDSQGVPFGINFGGLKGSEQKLIEIAFGFEQATKIRKPPSFKP